MLISTGETGEQCVLKLYSTHVCTVEPSKLNTPGTNESSAQTISYSSEVLWVQQTLQAGLENSSSLERVLECKGFAIVGHHCMLPGPPHIILGGKGESTYVLYTRVRGT